MGITSDQPKNVIKPKRRNHWEMAFHTVENPRTGPVLTINHNAMDIVAGAPGETIIVEGSIVPQDKVVYSGTRLNEIVAGAGVDTFLGFFALANLPDSATIGQIKAILSTTQGKQGAGLAYFDATKSNLYGAMDADGFNPLRADET